MKIILSALVCALSIGSMSGAVIFSEDFSSDTGGLAKTSLTNFNVLNGTNVDIGDFGGSCNAGASTCLDSQGSGGNSSGDIESKLSFVLGAGINYNLSFTVNNGGAASVRVRVGNALDTIFTNNGTYNLAFTATAQSATLRFTDQGPNDNVGLYIGNIVLSDDVVTGAVPEPSSMALLAAGAGLLFARRRWSN